MKDIMKMKQYPTQVFLLFLFSCLFQFSFGQQQGVADFSWSPDPVCEGTPVTFQDQSTGFIAPQYYWDFGDGTFFQDFTNGSPTHVYAAAGTYIVYLCIWDSVTFDSACVSYQVTVISGCDVDTLRGKVFADANGNGSFDAGDYALPGQLIEINPGPIYWSADNNGDYELLLSAGTYTVSLAGTPTHYSVQSPSSGMHTFIMPASQQLFTGDFALAPDDSIQDLCVSVLSTPVRPGFDANYWVNYTNVGTLPMSGTVRLVYDNNFSYVGSNPVAISNPAASTVELPFTNLLPTETRTLNVVLNLPASVALGTVVTAIVSVDPTIGDENEANNIATYDRTVIGSYDPNDKQVHPEGDINPNQNLLYTIRFQNTGTASAINVEIKDQLSPNVSIETFQMTGASHSYTFDIDEDRWGTWRFENIHLPDSNTNEPESHGFVQYRIDPVLGLSDGQTISNTAEIYFDFNAPIITNTVTSTIDSKVTGLEESLELTAVSVFPNPATDVVRIQWDNPNAAEFTLNLMNMSGQTVKVGQTYGNAFNVSVNSLSAGTYFYTIQGSDGHWASGKIMVQ